ncbi:MAG TPA: DUF1801 domain-containing protein, partial [Chthoniobacterales bacterium]
MQKSRKDPRVDAYIDKAAPFAKPILTHLRKVVHTACPDVEETIKWSHPHFDYQGVMCGMAAFKNHCVFGFWKAALIFKSADKKRHAFGDFRRLKSIHDLPNHDALIAYVRKAAKLNANGIKAPSEPKAKKDPATLKVPDDLRDALARNRKAKKTWDAFSYSHR